MDQANPLSDFVSTDMDYAIDHEQAAYLNMLNDTDHDWRQWHEDEQEQQTDALLESLKRFSEFWERLLSVYQPLEIAVLCFGLFGNVLALATLMVSQKMRTPSFVYHKALVGANLAFCINFFLNLFIDRYLQVHCRQSSFVFRYWLAAFFSGTINLTANNICGYVILYATLVIALDRVAAVLFFKQYNRWNHRPVACSVVLLTIFLSTALHSWNCFVQNHVIEYRTNLDKADQLFGGPPCWNESSVYYWVKRPNLSSAFESALRVKDFYNGTARVIYPILLTALTLAVIFGLLKRQRRRQYKRQRAHAAAVQLNGGLSVNDNFPAQTHTELSAGAATSVAGVSMPSHRTTTFSLGGSSPNHSAKAVVPGRRGGRRDKTLFLLMIAVVILAFLQVAAGEARRFMQIWYPADVLIVEKVANQSLPLEERLAYFHLVLYGHQSTRMLANFCTAIDRSFICILYMAMNKLFRRELLSMLRRCWSTVKRSRPCCRMLRDHLAVVHSLDRSNYSLLWRRNNQQHAAVLTPSAVIDIITISPSGDISDEYDTPALLSVSVTHIANDKEAVIRKLSL